MHIPHGKRPVAVIRFENGNLNRTVFFYFVSIIRLHRHKKKKINQLFNMTYLPFVYALFILCVSLE